MSCELWKTRSPPGGLTSPRTPPHTNPPRTTSPVVTTSCAQRRLPAAVPRRCTKDPATPRRRRIGAVETRREVSTPTARPGIAQDQHAATHGPVQLRRSPTTGHQGPHRQVAFPTEAGMLPRGLVLPAVRNRLRLPPSSPRRGFAEQSSRYLRTAIARSDLERHHHVRVEQHFPLHPRTASSRRGGRPAVDSAAARPTARRSRTSARRRLQRPRSLAMGGRSRLWHESQGP